MLAESEAREHTAAEQKEIAAWTNSICSAVDSYRKGDGQLLTTVAQEQMVMNEISADIFGFEISASELPAKIKQLVASDFLVKCATGDDAAQRIWARKELGCP